MSTADSLCCAAETNTTLESNYNKSFPGGSVGKESACKWETWVQSLGWEGPLEEGMATHSSIQ